MGMMAPRPHYCKSTHNITYSHHEGTEGLITRQRVNSRPRSAQTSEVVYLVAPRRLQSPLLPQSARAPAPPLTEGNASAEALAHPVHLAQRLEALLAAHLP